MRNALPLTHKGATASSHPRCVKVCVCVARRRGRREAQENKLSVPAWRIPTFPCRDVGMGEREFSRCVTLKRRRFSA